MCEACAATADARKRIDILERRGKLDDGAMLLVRIGRIFCTWYSTVR
jgi:hypothetical protein